MGVYDCDCIENLLSERKNRLDNGRCSEKPNNSKLRSGVLIEGMQIPYECRMCPLCRYFSSAGVTKCMVTQATLAEDYKTIQFEGRHEKCPLVEVKEDGE